MGRVKLALLVIQGLASVVSWLWNRKRCPIVEAPEFLKVIDLGERMNGTTRLFGRRLKLKPARSNDTAKFVGEAKNLLNQNEAPVSIDQPYKWPMEIDLWRPAGAKLEISGMYLDESDNVSDVVTLTTLEFKDNMKPEPPELEEVIDLGEQA